MCVCVCVHVCVKEGETGGTLRERPFSFALHLIILVFTHKVKEKENIL